MAASKRHHDLAEILERHLLILRDLFDLHGAPELVVVHQLGKSEQAVVAF
jgi:hypothetical protein